MPTRSTANALVITSVAAAIIAAVAASAYRWRAKVADLSYRAGFAAGRAWSAFRRFTARLLHSWRRPSS